VSSYSDFTRPILESADEIDRRFQAAKAEARRSVSTEDAWSQRLAPAPGCRCEDFAFSRDDVPSVREVSPHRAKNTPAYRREAWARRKAKQAAGKGAA
jgi:hypothetical protein